MDPDQRDRRFLLLVQLVGDASRGLLLPDMEILFPTKVSGVLLECIEAYCDQDYIAFQSVDNFTKGLHKQLE